MEIEAAAKDQGLTGEARTDIQPAKELGPAKMPVVVFGDFICPFSYISQYEVDRLAQEYDVEPQWRPHWLHPETPPEGMKSHSGASVDPNQRAATLAWLKNMSPEMAGPMRFPDKLQFSFFAFAAMEFAQDRGLAVPLRKAIFDALWVEGKDIGEIATLREVAAKVGLDSDELVAKLCDEQHLERTLEAVRTAQRIGITGTPTIFLGRARVNGWHYYEVLQTLIEQQGAVPKSASGTMSPDTSG